MPRVSVQRLSEAPAQQECSRSGAEIIQRPVHFSAFSLNYASAVPPISLNTSVLQQSAAKSSASWGLQAGSNPSTDCCSVAAHSLAASPTRKPVPPLPHRLDLPCRQLLKFLKFPPLPPDQYLSVDWPAVKTVTFSTAISTPKEPGQHHVCQQRGSAAHRCLCSCETSESVVMCAHLGVMPSQLMH